MSRRELCRCIVSSLLKRLGKFISGVYLEREPALIISSRHAILVFLISLSDSVALVARQARNKADDENQLSIHRVRDRQLAGYTVDLNNIPMAR
jgi:hypothetical protein